ncbi:glycoside hydrolase family 43 protein [Clostridium sp. SYSU_GA19001]|uniref:glycoside hydrolase family 43 protein n=1 Tax=Clostridium caldaquaticum TaxID=2940653 RepID=UPI0020776197|nr:glycoside hydrolase family 43 protein [Clostridium caldaquaticum]MCM8710041.1 glycoside hydrolase family 43 protein [Clostridium caldaquaticum]
MSLINKEKQTFSNPILPGFYPDPSICRVNEDYYMVTSSFAYFPGVPIFHSKDLVNWEQIGHVLDRQSQLDLDGAGISGGIFAPTIRYYKRTFYLITTNITNGGNFIVTSENPAGPWSEPYWLKNAPGIDPSLFFDEDGRVYYTGTRPAEDAKYFGDHEIWCQELDLKTMTLIGERHGLWRGALKNAHCPEGPHLYKINGYYYLLIAEGGTEHYHAVTIARSKNVFGPYEGNPGNPILTHRHLGKKHPISNPGHGDLVETQNGEWWMVALASRPYGGYFKNLGRETFLIPVEWEDGWPIVSPGTGKVESSYKVPDLPVFSVKKAEIRDDFDKEILSYIWNGIRTPREEFYSLTERPGFLRLKLRPQTLVDTLKMPSFDFQYVEKENFIIDCPSFIGRRQQHMNFIACVKMEFNPQKDYETAGLVLIQNNNFQYRFEYSIVDGQKVIRLIKCISKTDINFALKTFNSENIERKLAQAAFDSEVIYLKVSADGQDYNFYYGDSLENMKLLIGNVDGRILSPDMAGGFVGTYIGMFASSNGKFSSNYADFDWFEYKGGIVK